jgi:small GTP-binding protein
MSNFFNEVSEYDYYFKIVLEGTANTGKTRLIGQYSSGTFPEPDDYKATIGVEFSVRIVTFRDKKIKLQIWDSSGNVKYKSLDSPYFRGAKACIFTFDLNSEGSFESVKQRMEQTAKERYLSGVYIVLAGNKSDLPHAVTQEAIDRFLEEWKYKNPDFPIQRYIETSAKQNHNVSELFETTAAALLANLYQEPPKISPPEKQEPNAATLKAEFVEAFNERISDDRARYCGMYRFFVNSGIERRLDTVSLGTIILHAQSANNRSRDVCVALGWLTPNGEMSANAPAAIRRLNEIESSDDSNNPCTSF